MEKFIEKEYISNEYGKKVPCFYKNISLEYFIKAVS